MTRYALAFLAIVCFGGAAEARVIDQSFTSGPRNTLDMTCAKAREYVAKNDGVALRTGNVWASYHTSFCNSGSSPGSAPAFVRTKDQRLCFVGISCNCQTGFCPQSYWQGAE